MLVLKIPLDAGGECSGDRAEFKPWPYLHKWGSHTTSEKVFSKQELGFVHLCIHRSGHRVSTQ